MPTLQRPSDPRRAIPRARRCAPALLALAGLFGAVQDAGAVFTFTGSYGTIGLVMQVGSPNLVDEVVFNVTGTNLGKTPAAVPGTVSGSASGVVIKVTPTRPLLTFPDSVTVTVDSSLALSCQTPATCSGVNIPFTNIRWTSTDATTPSGGNTDIQSGTFTGTAGQEVARYSPWGFLEGSRQMSNTLNFSYINTTLYPAGTYKGSVRFTATML